jgi:hypothetical protein
MVGSKQKEDRQVHRVTMKWINVHVGSLLGQSFLLPDIGVFTAVVTAI